MIDYEEDIKLKWSERLFLWKELTRLLFNGMIRKEHSMGVIKLKGDYSMVIELKVFKEFVK